jgi:hypothetical protein
MAQATLRQAGIREKVAIYTTLKKGCELARKEEELDSPQPFVLTFFSQNQRVEGEKLNFLEY